ncbi:hydroxymethylpyrimidine/phosphomethylpyrimidine kinase [Rubritalea squalenifaciens DSM 18772]|uniref:hydroxymethylpyrimidine kinase n=1 Tax=Rubritalea squalenifaciens DSM 18772 TaxID=1123071 RepID=A0A1M6JCI5_9BACT|nr:bifunctional hydroxymethylpyrimidine kinase/phosphomethylpyrimidine kinase [Rubritalea squalenifaciens]SHJ44419.1 hydroxymethylpyrimidine/phosphomethylpyrimidine kinase [Rubritalea squalenifaciens DSM 18772]
MNMTPVALTIAGSDCSSGAGIQADLKTFSYLGVHGLTAVTCVVSETPHTVSDIHAVPPAILQDQVRLLLKTYPVAAIKTGMLYSKSHIVAITELLENSTIPLIVDPVMVATSGSSLLKDDAVRAYMERLFPLATLITPNMPEASVLLEREITQSAEMEDAARELAEKFSTSVLLKGGHLPESEDRLDILCHEGQIHRFTSSTVDLHSTHGTGCTLSAAIAALIARGSDLPTAVSEAKQWLHGAILNSLRWPDQGQGETLCLNHLRTESL